MDHDFWHDRWNRGQIGFHQAGVHPDLEASAAWFLDGAPRQVLVPLAGKSWDLPWLAGRGHRVVGSELSAVAVDALFAEHGLLPTVEEHGEHRVVRHGALEVWQGDFFSLPDAAGPFDRVWDRAALVALEPPMRDAYLRALVRLAPGALVLLNALDYDPTVMGGPPFPINGDEVHRLYGPSGLGAQVEPLGSKELIAREPRWAERGHTWFHSDLYRIVLPKTA